MNGARLPFLKSSTRAAFAFANRFLYGLYDYVALNRVCLRSKFAGALQYGRRNCHIHGMAFHMHVISIAGSMSP